MTAALALLSSLLWGTSDFLGGTLTRRVAAPVVVLASQSAALVTLVPVVLVLGAARAPALTDVLRAVAVDGVLAGVVGPLALLAFYRALSLGSMGVVAPVAALGVVVPVLVGLASGEAPGATQLAGIVVAAAGVVLASGPELRGDDRSGARSVALAGGAALGFGTVLALLARAADTTGCGTCDGVARLRGVVVVLLVMRATSVPLLGLLALRQGRGAGRAGRAGWAALALVGLFDLAANGTYALSTQRGLVSVTAVLASLYPVVTGLLAWRVHGERLARVQWCGVGLAMSGVVLLAVG